MANRGYDLDDTPTPASQKSPRVEQLVDVAEITNRYQTYRLVGKVFAYGIHWVTTKKRDGSKASFPTPCLAFDSETGLRDSTKPCPWCAHEGKEIRFTVDYYTNAISRKRMLSAPAEPDTPTKQEQASGFKSKDSDTFTIYEVLRMAQAVVRSIKGLRDLNVHEDANGDSQGFPVSHPKYGCHISIKKDPDAPPASRYSVQKLDHKPLTKREKSFLQWDLSNLIRPPSLEEATREYKSWAERMGLQKKSRDDDEDDDDDTPRKKRRVTEDDDEDEPPVRKKRRAVDDDDDDDTPAPRKKRQVVDEDEDDEPAPKKKRRVVDEDDDEEPPAPRKKRPPVDDDEEEEEAPRKKRRPPVDEDDDDEPLPKKKRRVVDEDDDEEEAPAPRKKKSPPPFDVDEDEDDEPKPKKKRPPVDEDDEEDIPVRKSKKRRVVDEDDDDIPY